MASLVAAARSASDAAALRSAQAIRTGELLLLLITALGIVGAAAIMLRYVVPRVVGPLEAMTAAMTDLAAGDTSVAIPGRDRRDEIGRMAEALAVFRDTAVEIEEKNLREVAAARQRLIDAIESSSEGFALFDAEDRLVLCNGHFRELYPGLADVIVPGAPFAAIARAAAERRVIRDAAGSADEWLERRLALHRTRPVRRCRCRATAAGSRSTSERPGTVGPSPCYTDVTEIKRAEQALLTAQARLDLPADLVAVDDLQLRGGRKERADVHQRERARPARLRAERVPRRGRTSGWSGSIPRTCARVLAEFPRLLELGHHVLRVPVPPQGRHLPLGPGRAAPGPRRGRRTARGRRVVERHHRAQGRPSSRSASRRPCSG